MEFKFSFPIPIPIPIPMYYIIVDKISKIIIIDPSPTNRSFCTMCKQTRSISEFPLNRNGAPYKTCRLCKERSASNRRVLGEIDPNARSLRNRTVSARPQTPRPQKRRRVDNVQSNATVAAGITGAEGRAEQHVMEGDVSV